MKVNLRQIEEEDLARVRDWRNDDRLRKLFREYRLLNMLNQHDWLVHVTQSRDVEMYCIDLMLEIDGRPIGGLVGVCGLCNISWINRTAEISLYIGPECQQPGLALTALRALEHKAFDELNLRRLWAEVYEFSKDQIDLLLSAGYVCEGLLQEHVFKLGKYYDSLIYGRLKGEEK